MHMTATDADRMAAGLGADAALDVVEQINSYADQHIECTLLGADVVNRGNGHVEVRVRHQPGCPAMMEGTTP